MLENKTDIYIDNASLLFLSKEWAYDVHVYENIIEIFRKHARLYTDLSISELDDIYNPKDANFVDPIHDFSSAKELPEIQSACETFNKLSDETEYEKYSCAIFILDKDRSYTSRIRSEYGVWVVSIEELSNRTFEYEFPKSFDDDELEIKNNDGWETVLSEEKTYIPVSNSAVLSDSHLMENDFLDENGMKRYHGLENLKYLLKTILPQTLVVPFYLYVICPTKINASQKKVNRIIEQWINEIKLLRKYNIIVEFLTTKKTLHSRNLYTNYYFIDFDRGCYVFDKGYGKVHVDGSSFNKINIVTYLTNPFSRGETKLAICKAELQKLKDKYEKMIRETGEVTIHEPYEKNEFKKNRIIF